jgi:hypothetical protein
LAPQSLTGKTGGGAAISAHLTVACRSHPAGDGLAALAGGLIGELVRRQARHFDCHINAIE